MSIEFPESFAFDAEEYFLPPVPKVNNEAIEIEKCNNLERIIDEHRNKLSIALDDTIGTTEDTVRTVVSIAQKKEKPSNQVVNDDEDELFDFKEVVENYDAYESFMDMKILSRNLLKALTENKLYKPTPIQAACIPIVLLGRDICASAQTGSGKTLAFLLPIIERMLRSPSIKVGKYIQPKTLIVSPTRELAMQTLTVTNKIIAYCPQISVQLVTGGLKRSNQEAALRNGADIIIATPGRLIDFVHNTPNFDLKKIKYLILDEADRMLDEHYIEQTEEIVKQCSPGRQAILFSATMTENVKKLASLSLKNPAKIFVNPSNEVAENLEQQIVRIRSHRVTDREAMLLSLVCRNFNKRTIIFMPTKNQCHRMHIMLGLLGIKCGELHSNMTQAQRLDALSRFACEMEDQSQKIDILVCTDLASRGLDIDNVQTVINFLLPKQYEQYIHRVGRTARNTRSGVAISIVSDDDRVLLKEIKTNSTDDLKLRKIDPAIIEYYNTKVEELKDTIAAIIEQERIDKESEQAELELERANEALENKDKDIETRKRFNWFTNKRGPEEDTDAPKRKRMRGRDKYKQQKNEEGKPSTKGKAFSKKIEKMTKKKASKNHNNNKKPRK